MLGSYSELGPLVLVFALCRSLVRPQRPAMTLTALSSGLIVPLLYICRSVFSPQRDLRRWGRQPQSQGRKGEHMALSCCPPKVPSSCFLRHVLFKFSAAWPNHRVSLDIFLEGTLALKEWKDDGCPCLQRTLLQKYFVFYA